MPVLQCPVFVIHDFDSLEETGQLSSRKSLIVNFDDKLDKS